jgi:hypothetical protein
MGGQGRGEVVILNRAIADDADLDGDARSTLEGVPVQLEPFITDARFCNDIRLAGAKLWTLEARRRHHCVLCLGRLLT